jgi:hypothetical protein
MSGRAGRPISACCSARRWRPGPRGRKCRSPALAPLSIRPGIAACCLPAACSATPTARPTCRSTPGRRYCAIRISRLSRCRLTWSASYIVAPVSLIRWRICATIAISSATTSTVAPGITTGCLTRGHAGSRWSGWSPAPARWPMVSWSRSATTKTVTLRYLL